jgi:hypothetical protein
MEGCTSTFPPNASNLPVGCSIPSTCLTNGCLPVSCIPQACLAPGVTQATLASFTIFSKVPANDLISPEQALYNVLGVYFDGTPVASFFGGTPGAAPLNYLQIYSPDIQYATANANAPAQVVENGVAVSTTAQALLNLASQKLPQIADNVLQPFAAGGLSFSAAGTTGSINLTFPAGFVWTAASSASWLTITGPSTGTGSGALTYQIAANAGGDRSATITIGGYTFTVEQQASSIPGLSFIGSMPHLAAEGGWLTTFTFVNKSSTVQTARTNLFTPAGAALPLPIALPQQTAINGDLLASSLDQTIAANAQFVMQATGPANVPYLEGSAQLNATGTVGESVDGFAIFHYNPNNQEAVVPMETRNAASYILPFDNTNGVLTGVAIENVSTQAANIPVTLRNDSGAQVGAGTISLNALGHTSFVLSTQFPPTANIRGTVECDTPTNGQISLLGIRYTGGTLTTIPVLANVGTSGGLMAHLASGNGWQTTFVLVNTGTTSASAMLNFYADNGSAQPLPLTTLNGPNGAGSLINQSSIAQTVLPNASVWILAAAPVASALLTGSAVLTTTGNVSGHAIFRYNPNGQEAVVPLESRNAGTYFLAFDNTNNTTTGVAINSISAQNTSVPVTLRDDQGNILTTSTIALNANGHTSFLLATQYPQTAGLRGTAEFDTPGFGTANAAKISVLGIRSPPALTFTTLPALAK